MKTVCGLTMDEYIKRIEMFHGNLAPGLLIGGFMVDLAQRNRPEGEFFDVLCETSACLPDAIQILTPCTYGNGWLKVINIGRFALTMFEKHSGKGVRVHLDVEKLDEYPEIKNWFLQLKTKKEQDKDKLIHEITTAGNSILGMAVVSVVKNIIKKSENGNIGICPECGEAYPEKDGSRCLACHGVILYNTKQ